MKTWVIALLCFALCILLGLLGHRFLQRSSQRLSSQINRFDRTVQAHQWQTAQKHLSALNRQWRKIASIWAVLIHHQEIDNIENALSRLRGAIRGRNYSDALMISQELQHFLQHIPQREQFTVINIL
jgi:hypothetical protein